MGQTHRARSKKFKQWETKITVTSNWNESAGMVKKAKYFSISHTGKKDLQNWLGFTNIITMQTIQGYGFGSLSLMATLTQIKVQHLSSSKWNISKQGYQTIVDAILNNIK